VTSCKAEKSSLLFSEAELSLLDKTNIPYHVAIIPDGNRRWAKGQLKDVEEGYQYGAETLITTVRAAKELGIKVLTVFAFSTENWRRPRLEIDALMAIFESYLRDYREKLRDMSIRVRTIGDASTLPASLKRVVDETCEATKDCTEFDLVLAMNYGSRDEICRAVKKIVGDCLAKKLNPQAVTEKSIAQYLDTALYPDPDLLIRTSGELRISNFLLWQSSYTEIYIEEAAWPSFTPKHLLQAVMSFQKRDRRKGGGQVGRGILQL
jgi:undecaprenyl diphosphate synthase